MTNYLDFERPLAEIEGKAEELRAMARQNAEMDLKEALYGERYPLDTDFVAAVAHMPEASGVALGFDRLVMLASGAASVNDVLWTPPAISQEQDT